MVQLSKQHAAFIELVAHGSKNQVKALMLTMSTDQLKLICSILTNIRFKVIPTSEADKRTLQRKSKIILEVIDKSTSTTHMNRKEILSNEPTLMKFVAKLFLDYINE